MSCSESGIVGAAAASRMKTEPSVAKLAHALLHRTATAPVRNVENEREAPDAEREVMGAMALG